MSTASMDFGRIEHIEQVDFRLPPAHKSLAKVLGGVPHPQPRVYVGGVLWASESFPGTIYPQNAKQADYVKHYTRQFNTIELNATHYRVPSAQTLQRWRDVAPDGFKFCPKIHQSVSHADHLPDLEAYQLECNQLFSLLQDKLGTVFMQLPPQFSPARLEELAVFLDRCAPPGMALELRHTDWFRNDGALNTLCNFLYKKNLGLVLTDTPGRRDVLHMRLTNKTAFVRFNGHNGFEGDKARMDAWVEKVLEWMALGLESFYFFVHTPQQLYMPRLVDYFIEELEKAGGPQLQAPVFYT